MSPAALPAELHHIESQGTGCCRGALRNAGSPIRVAGVALDTYASGKQRILTSGNAALHELVFALPNGASIRCKPAHWRIAAARVNLSCLPYMEPNTVLEQQADGSFQDRVRLQQNHTPTKNCLQTRRPNDKPGSAHHGCKPCPVTTGWS